MIEPTNAPVSTGHDARQPVELSLPWGTTPAPEAAPAPDPELTRLATDLGRGVSWMHWAIGLSVVNAISAAAGASWSFALALAVSLFPAVLAHQISVDAGMPWLNVIGVAIALVPPAVLFGLVWLGKRDRPWALLTALVFYACDAALFAAFGDWLSVILHAVGLYFVFRAWQASRALFAYRVTPG